VRKALYKSQNLLLMMAFINHGIINAQFFDIILVRLFGHFLKGKYIIKF
jgi:hypothetical protein